jgi:hypothetical protein
MPLILAWWPLAQLSKLPSRPLMPPLQPSWPLIRTKMSPIQNRMPMVVA